MPAVLFHAHRAPIRRRTSVTLPLVVAAILGGLLHATFPAEAVDAATLQGTAFYDHDRDGLHDPEEPPRAGDTIWLFDLDAQAFVTKQDTDAHGRFAFAGLPTGRTYRLQLQTEDWWARWEQEVPTTTPSLQPIHDVVLHGDAVRDFGWREIVTTAVGDPVSTYVAPSGLTVETYNDAVTAQQVHDVLATGLIGPEAPVTTVRVAAGGASTTATSVQQTDGRYHSFAAIVNITWLAWLTEPTAETLAHEYGHAWGWYHAYESQQDPTFSGYLEARGLLDDPRVESTYVWSSPELLAEDYQQLLGPTSARDGEQMNRDIPRAEDVPGLLEYLRDDFTQPIPAPDSEASPETEPTPEPEADVTPPTVDIAKPTDGSTVVEGTLLDVVVDAVDDVSATAALSVELVLDDRVVHAVHDATRDVFVAQIDTAGLKGTYSVVATAWDAAGNDASAAVTVEVTKAKGGGKDGGAQDTCRGNKC